MEHASRQELLSRLRKWFAVAPSAVYGANMAKYTEQQARIRAMRREKKTTAEIAAILRITPAGVRAVERYRRSDGTLRRGRPPKCERVAAE